MSEAHENTRIRQLTDAAAHWEHKYTRAREYNRNLEARILKLESLLVRALATGQLQSARSPQPPHLADEIRTALEPK